MTRLWYGFVSVGGMSRSSIESMRGSGDMRFGYGRLGMSIDSCEGVNSSPTSRPLPMANTSSCAFSNDSMSSETPHFAKISLRPRRAERFGGL